MSLYLSHARIPVFWLLCFSSAMYTHSLHADWERINTYTGTAENKENGLNDCGNKWTHTYHNLTPGWPWRLVIGDPDANENGFWAFCDWFRPGAENSTPCDDQPSQTWSQPNQQCEPTPDPPGPDEGNQPCSNKAANPITISTGNKYQVETDYHSNNLFSLEVKRYYNSKLEGWRFNGDHSLSISLDEVVWTTETGKGLTFTQLNAQWQVPFRPKLALVELPDGSWEITDEDLTVYKFSDSGQLTSVTRKSGISHTYTYNVMGLKETVAHSLGGQLTYTYNIHYQVASFTTPDGEEVRYEYDGENLVKVESSLLPNPRLYHYEDANFPNALTGITDELGHRYATWSYDSEGRAVSSEHTNGADRYTFQYHADGSTTVTNPLGKQATYHFEQFHGADKTVLIEGHASVACAAANKAYTYTADGLVETQTDWQGRITRFTYDERGLVIQKTEAEGTPEQRVTTTEWHPDFALPTKIIKHNRQTDFTYDSQGNLLTQTTSEI